MVVISSQKPHIGTAGWAIPSTERNCFPEGNSLLERYSQQFNAVEINSSFYRSHKKTTYTRWFATTPDDFLFAVKMPKEITHIQRLVKIEALLTQFLQEIEGLQTKLGVLLIQLPPSLKFDVKNVKSFFKLLREHYEGKIAIEPRHLSWANDEASSLLTNYRTVCVIADPEIIPLGVMEKQEFSYYRLHGSPIVYSSSYSTSYLNELAHRLDPNDWVIFDNTKFGAATQNALYLKDARI